MNDRADLPSVLSKQHPVPRRRMPLEVPPSGPVLLPPVKRYRARPGIGGVFGLIILAILFSMLLACVLVAVRAVAK